jgi:cardiolipin synthase
MLTDLPNLLTLSRIAAIPLLVVLVALHEPAADMAACVLFSTAAITDYFDGHLARTRPTSVACWTRSPTSSW